jgi:catechol-2,3-dioxygenase
MRIENIHHVQLPYPPGRQSEARHFYGEILGLRELPRPAALADRPGLWYDLGGGQQLHLLEIAGDAASPSYHFGLLVPDLAALHVHLAAHTVPVDDKRPFPDHHLIRALLHDPFGNAIELLQRTPGT